MNNSRIFMAPVLVFIGLYAGAHFASDSAFRHFWARNTELDADPPWYFIGQDLVAGLVYLIALVLTLLVALGTRRRYGLGSWMAAWMALAWMGYPAAQACLILVRTTRIWDSGAAVSQWRTFEHYTGDPVRGVVFGLSLAVALVFAIASRRFFLVQPTESTRRS